MKEHHYHSNVVWTGNTGSGTSDYQSYKRSYSVEIKNKPVIEGSSDAAFRGNPHKHNPEDLFLSSVSSCHMLWYLHFCSVNQIVVEEYTDYATGIMVEEMNGSGRFKEIVLHPVVTVQSPEMQQKAILLHKKAHEYCFIANSVNFPVTYHAQILVKSL